MWQNLLVLLVLGYFIYLIDKRVRKLEEVRGPGYPQSFSIDARGSILKHKRFGELTGIKSAIEGKNYKEWSSEDRTKLSRPIRALLDKSRIWITYLQGENAYFVKTLEGNSTILRRDETDTTDLLYDCIVAGDPDGVDSHLSLTIYERWIKGFDGKHEYVIVPCLTYRDEDMDKEDEFEALCEFPLFRQFTNDEQINRLGFEIKESGGGDVYEDSFGEKHAIPTIVTFEKNGVEIKYA